MEFFASNVTTLQIDDDKISDIPQAVSHILYNILANNQHSKYLAFNFPG